METAIKHKVLRDLERLSAEQLDAVLEFIEFFLSRRQALPSVFETIETITTNVPDEQWDNLPKDGATQHDHYHYGLPKR